ncbi:HNH endonuclease [Actinoplanes sp. URMC 104]|uniref:HNH endonuclease n=1 Tax=Actinoplanes sp. URMC 104 TaxID=3423409 RepID=UPI003F1E2863
MTLSTCTVCRRPIPVGQSRCSIHKPKRRHALSASQRGYDAVYRRNRATLLAGDPPCSICRRAVATTADHIVPLSKGGTNDITNLRPACGRCNYARGNRG